MPRPPKCRRVEAEPQVTYFKPAGIPKHDLEELVLSVDELEAIRLKDLEGLDQENCAERMHVSRPTFQRILSCARSKLAEALILGKAIRVEGGHYRVQTARCAACNREFTKPHGRSCRQNMHCPSCGEHLSEKIKD